MCGRFTLSTSWEDLKRAFPEFEFIFEENDPVSYNIAPSQKVLVASALKPEIVKRFTWGLVPSWSKDDSFSSKLINARGETVFTKPSFRNAIRQRRCLVFTSGFFEWKKEGKTKQPYFIKLKSNDPFTFGGIWETWKQPDGAERKTFSVITTPANLTISAVHHRMPLIVSKNQYHLWLNHHRNDEEAIARIIQQNSKNEFEYFAVSKRVNSVKNNDSDCIKLVV